MLVALFLRQPRRIQIERGAVIYVSIELLILYFFLRNSVATEANALRLTKEIIGSEMGMIMVADR